MTDPVRFLILKTWPLGKQGKRREGEAGRMHGQHLDLTEQ